MNIIGLHPRSITLNRYADRTLDARDMGRTSEHLIRCAQCRAGVERIKQVGELARAEAAPVPTPALFDGVIARREAGDRVILPVAESRPARRMSPWSTVAAAGIAFAVGAAALLSSRSAGASSGDGELLFYPAHPPAGATVEATYNASDRFSADSILMLRARFVTSSRHEVPTFESLPVERFVMKRNGDGTFRVSFQLPPGAIYSAYAVEDSAALRLDSHGGHLWELLASRDSGRPTYTAIEAAAEHRIGWDARHAAARDLLDAFPDSVGAWRLLTWTGSVAQGETDTAFLSSAHRALVRFDESARRAGSVDVPTVTSLYSLAQGLHDTARTQYWKAYALKTAPRSALAARLRAVDIIESVRPRDSLAIARALPGLDRLWQDVGAVDPSFTTFGMQGAEAAKDPAAIERWGRRLRDMSHDSPDSREWVGRELAKYPSTRQDGLALLRTLVAPVDVVNDPRRRLRETSGERLRVLDEDRARVLQYIGEGLLSDHQPLAARDTLRLAARMGWNVVRFRDIAGAALSAGDTAHAVEMLALVAVDPGTAPAFADSARARLGDHLTDSAWSSATIEGRTLMRERLLAMSTRSPLRGERVHLRSATGDTHTFAEIARGHLTVVAFGGDLLYKSSPVDLRAMQQLASSISPQGARVVVIAIHPWSPGMVDSLRVRHVSVDVEFDDRREADRAFNAYGFPAYYVVDAAGRIRFAWSRPDQLRAQVAVLTQEAQVATRR